MSKKQAEPLIPPLDTLPRISLKGTEVVRRQYLSHIKDNVVNIRPDGIQFNTACITRMENVVYIQIMIDRKRKWMIVRGCDEEDRDAQRWCNIKEEGRKPRKITGKDFAIRIYRMMQWNRGYYFKVCGSFAVRDDKEDELLLVFELEESENTLCHLLQDRKQAWKILKSAEKNWKTLMILKQLKKLKRKSVKKLKKQELNLKAERNSQHFRKFLLLKHLVRHLKIMLTV